MKDDSFTSSHIFKAVLLGAALIFASCSENEAEPLGELNKNFADRTTLNAFLTYKDSGRVNFELRAPLIEEFTLIDSPYVLMSKGVEIKFWDKKSPDPNFLYADWAKMYDKKKFYEGKGHVKIINYDGDTLLTEHIFWDNYNGRIYSEDTVTIKRIDGTINISNHGMDATEDFKQFTFFDNHGIYIFDQDQNHKGMIKSGTEKSTKNSNDSIVENRLIPLSLEK